MKKPDNFGHDGISARQYLSPFPDYDETSWQPAPFGGKLDVERLHSKLKITRKQKYMHKLYCTCHIICCLQKTIYFGFFYLKNLCPVKAFCLVDANICKSCEIQNHTIKKVARRHHLYISLGHSENIRHIIMPFRKSTNSFRLLPWPRNCPTPHFFPQHEGTQIAWTVSILESPIIFTVTSLR